jgi:uncharacterized membrane protein HdeD (DUF308 family)
MAVDNAAVAPAAPMGEVSFPWWVNLVAGIVLIIVGLLLLTAPVSTTAVLIQFLALFWLIDGVIRLASLFVNRSGWGWKVCMGVIGIIAGLATLQHPLWATILVPATLVLVVGIMGIILGIVQIVAAFRGAGWGTGLLGAFSVVLGLIIITNPLQGTLALPFVLGFFAILGGIMALVTAVSSKVGFARRQPASPTTLTTPTSPTNPEGPATATTPEGPATPATPASGGTA